MEYITRIELILGTKTGDTRHLYEKIHEEMKAAGFQKTAANLPLPDGEYYISSTQQSIEQIEDLAEIAVLAGIKRATEFDQRNQETTPSEFLNKKLAPTPEGYNLLTTQATQIRNVARGYPAKKE